MEASDEARALLKSLGWIFGARLRGGIILHYQNFKEGGRKSPKSISSGFVSLLGKDQDVKVTIGDVHGQRLCVRRSASA